MRGFDKIQLKKPTRAREIKSITIFSSSSKSDKVSTQTINLSVKVWKKLGLVIEYGDARK